MVRRRETHQGPRTSSACLSRYQSGHSTRYPDGDPVAPESPLPTDEERIDKVAITCRSGLHRLRDTVFIMPMACPRPG